MKNLILTTILLTSWLGLFSQETTNPFTDPGSEAITSTFSKSYNPMHVEDFITDWAPDAHVPGLSACVLKNGELYWVHHYGYANITQQKPVDDNSVFYMASVSKTIAQTAIMQLWEQDYFELNDDISDSIGFPVINPHCPDSAITYFQLMTHTSSIVDNYTMIDQSWGSTLAEFMVGYLPSEGAYYSENNFSEDYCPGEQYNYTNVGNSVLGYLTQVMTDQNYGEYCEEFIFQPLGITEGSYSLDNIDPGHLVTQYNYYNGSYFQIPTPGGDGPISPATTLKISAIELSKFLGMYMKGGTYNDSTILSPETIELITTPTSVPINGGLQCLTWFHYASTNNTAHSGGTSFASTIMAYDKDEQCGNIVLMNTGTDMNDAIAVYLQIACFADQYDAFSLSSFSVADTDGDQVIEAGETVELDLALRNDMNYPSGTAENIIATITCNSPYITITSGSTLSLGTLNYLDVLQSPSSQIEFEVSEDMEPGNVEFQLDFTWDDGIGYTTVFKLFIGSADILLVRDEEGVSMSVGSGTRTIQETYLQSLDMLGFLTDYWDLETRGDPPAAFIQNFPAVIWFTGIDQENTLSENNQSLLADYLDNGGQLFLSGQNISDELEGTDFLKDYLSVEHIQDTWDESETIKGIEDDPVGNGQIYQLNTGDAIVNQTSMSVVEPLGDANKAFGYFFSMEGAAVRHENDTFKTVFFAFGLEAIDGFSMRTDILDRLLNDYFVISHSCLPEGITFTTQEDIDSFQLNYPGCDVIEGDVIIHGDDITNLNGLNILSSIGGSLSILYNNELTSLGGLDNLATINGSLYITGNNLLSDISSLQNLTHIGEDIVIGSLTQPAMPPPIGGNPLLTNLEGLNGISSIGGMLYFRANGGLTSLSGLENLASTGGSLVVVDNDSLPNFEGLKSLTTIGGSLGVFDNELLVSLSGLDSLSLIAGHLAIGSYEYFGGDGGNPALANLAGLEKLTAVGGEFEIINNSTLTTLMNLQSIEPGSIDSISIKDNPLLSECHAEAICTYLQSVDPVVEISGNANGCFSPENVIDVCNGVSVAEHKGEEVMSIFPNPCSGAAHLRISNKEQGTMILEVFTISGMKSMELMNEEMLPGSHEVEMDLKELPAGVYYLILKTNNGNHSEKLIKL